MSGGVRKLVIEIAGDAKDGVKAMKELGLTGLPVTHIENASATGLVAFREAAWAVATGRADVAMALCFDKMTEMGGSGASRGGGRDVIDAPILPASYFALWAQRRMYERGTTVETYAKIAAKSWNYGAASPMSHRQPDHVVTPEEVLASRMVARPLTSMMCCPADDGAACVILAREDLVRERQPGRKLIDRARQHRRRLGDARIVDPHGVGQEREHELLERLANVATGVLEPGEARLRGALQAFGLGPARILERPQCVRQRRPGAQRFREHLRVLDPPA